VTECLSDDLQHHWRREQNNLPIHLETAENPPGVTMQAPKDERRESPDRLFRAELPDSASGKAATNGEEGGYRLAGNEGGERHHRADDAPGIRPCYETCQEGALERQVGSVVSEEQSGGHACRQRYPKAEGEDEALRPRSSLGDENGPEALIPDEHDRQQGRNAQLDDQSRQQKLLGGQEA
jgi:hypothetical protein